MADANLAAFYQENGYAVVPVFSADDVVAAQADITAHIDRLSHALYLPFQASCPDTPLHARIDQMWQSDRSHAALIRQAICTDAHRGPMLDAIANDLNLRTMAEHLARNTLRDSVVRVRASIACFPEHHHPWHSDVARDDGSRCGKVLITAWVPLSHAGPDKGGLEVVSGRQTAPLAQLGNQGFAIPDDVIAPLMRISPECPAGHVIFLDRFTPHRTLPAPTARFALVVWFIAA
jgi:hypothetical protein